MVTAKIIIEIHKYFENNSKPLSNFFDFYSRPFAKKIQVHSLRFPRKILTIVKFSGLRYLTDWTSVQEKEENKCTKNQKKFYK